VNEFGALEVITDETEMESVKKATATTTWMVPTAQEGQLRGSKYFLWWTVFCLICQFFVKIDPQNKKKILICFNAQSSSDDITCFLLREEV